MQNYHTKNKIKFKGIKLIGPYFGKEIVLYNPLLKWYLQEGLITTKFPVSNIPQNVHLKIFQMKYQMQDVQEILIT
jgi:hypothetical protein